MPASPALTRGNAVCRPSVAAMRCAHARPIAATRGSGATRRAHDLLRGLATREVDLDQARSPLAWRRQGGTLPGGGSPTHWPVTLSLGAVPKSARNPCSVEHSRISLLT